MGILCNKGQLDGSQSEKRKTNHMLWDIKILNKNMWLRKAVSHSCGLFNSVM